MDQIEEKLVALATELGLTETPKMTELRPQIVAADRAGDRDLYINLTNQYADLGESLVRSIPDGGGYRNGQIAMNILRLRLAYCIGGMDDRTEGWYNDLYDQVSNLRQQETWSKIEAIFS